MAINQKPLGEEGFFHYPMAIALVAVVIAETGMWGILHQWRKNVEQQFRLNECVAKAALKFKESLEDIDSTNFQISGIRYSIAAAALLAPEALASLKIALKTEILRQEAILATWKLQEVKWVSQYACGKMGGDILTPLPRLNFRRDPPDLIGENGLSWIGVQPSEFKISARHKSRKAGAKIYGNRNNNQSPKSFISKSWTAEWWASIY